MRLQDISKPQSVALMDEHKYRRTYNMKTVYLTTNKVCWGIIMNNVLQSSTRSTMSNSHFVGILEFRTVLHIVDSIIIFIDDPIPTERLLVT